MYKILTSIITERTYNFLDNNNILPTEQKGCKRGSYSCKDQLLINKMFLENNRSSRKNLSTAWIDYRNAFDSVPHSWLLRVLELYKVSPTIINFLKIGMRKALFVKTLTLIVDYSRVTHCLLSYSAWP